jgi:peptide/nickel transport system ATP-binding protein
MISENGTRQPAIDVLGLTIGYRRRNGSLVKILNDTSLSLPMHGSVGLVGETGSGKSTLGAALLGFVRPGLSVLDGTVSFHGTSLFGLERRALRTIRGGRLAIVPQNAGQSLTPTMRIGKQVAEALVVHRGLSQRRATAEAVELLRQVRLPTPRRISRRYPHQLSGGQQQRVAIAMALSGEPELLVLDEPTTGLDVTTQAHILDLLRDVRQRTRAAMLVVSHDLGIVARTTDRVAVMYAGEIVEEGATMDVLAAARHPYTRALLEAVPRLSSNALPRPLGGRPPSPGERPAGCAFASRCAFADELCTTDAPRLRPTVSGPGGWSVRCHHWERIALVPRTDKQVDEIAAPLVAARDRLLTVANVSVTYGRRSMIPGRPSPPRVVDNVSLTVHPGEVLALVGESGSGKSTLARAIAGIHPPAAGEMTFLGRTIAPSITRRPEAQRKAIQLVFQNPEASLNPRHTIRKLVERPLKLFARGRRAARVARVEELLRDVGLSRAYLVRYPGQLSGGEKQRIGIARALAASPELVLCDEVVSSLDVSVQAAVLHLLSRLRAEHALSYLFISHDLAVVRAIADRVAVLYLGRLCELGTVADVYEPPYHPYTEALLGAVLEPSRAIGVRTMLLEGDEAEGEAPPRGCVFQRRCPRRIGPICDEEEPPWRVTESRNAIRCHIDLRELEKAAPLAAPPDARALLGR